MRSLVLLFLLMIAGCRPLYLPPVPAPLEVPARFELDGSATAQGGRPRLLLRLRSVPQEGWLAVQWFSPANRQVASESVWVAPLDEGRTIILGLPADIESTAGRWRAVLSIDGELVRQLSVEVPASGPPPSGQRSGEQRATLVVMRLPPR